MFLKSRKVIMDAAGYAQDMVAGSLLILDALSAGASIDVTWIDAQGHAAETVVGVIIGRRLHAGGQFSGYQLRGTPGATATLLVGPDSADAGTVISASFVLGHVISDAGSVVEVNNVPANAVPVKPGTGAQFDVLEKLGAALTNVAPVACSAVIAVALAADAARRKVVFRNSGANPIALVAAGGSYANAAIVLQPTEMWAETDAPGAAWYAICDAGLASTLNIITEA